MATVLLFAQAREAAGTRQVELPGATVADVLAAADERFGVDFARVRGSCSVVVDDELVRPDALAGLPAGDGVEVAVLPPVSGGAVDAPAGPILVAGLAAEPLDPAALVEQVRRPDCGGVVVFEGTTRSPNHDHDVLALEYEAWEDRVPAQLQRIAAEVAADHDLGGALAVHRTGRVGVGEPAVVVVAVAAHRDAAFAGARALIDRVKAEAWIWKKEHRADGEVWVEACP